MASIYTIEVVSHWVNYTPSEIKKKVEEALKSQGNEIQVNVERGKYINKKK